ncbi:DUF835 domain-containing protein [Thermococcus sp.]|uniref:DUF835 domain-containing protein n=1 Tax=Thermococcus sp. TaxID=35749 RepID=UPI0026048D56|nr:DUF835 domain-containing protein [Thermococcus sp.]
MSAPTAYIIAVKLITGLVFLRAFLRTGRRSALLLGAGWVLSGNLPLGRTTIGEMNMNPLLMGVSTSATIFGIMELIREERGRGPPKALLFSLPLVPLLYGAMETALRTDFGGTYVASGLLLIAGGGTLIEFLREYYTGRAVLLGMALITAGVSSMVYPFLYIHGNLNDSAVVYGSFALALFMVFAYHQLVSTEKFLRIEAVQMPDKRDPVLDNQVTIVSPREFEKLRKKLENIPVLAFVRNVKPGTGWIVYRISSVEQKEAISPTAIYQITQRASEYLQELTRKGMKGAIVIEGLEVLKVYNGFESMIKTLALLRDLARLFHTPLIVVTERGAWTESEWRILLRVLG